MEGYKQIITWKYRSNLEALRERFKILGWEEQKAIKAILIAFLYNYIDITREQYEEYGSEKPMVLKQNTLDQI